MVCTDRLLQRRSGPTQHVPPALALVLVTAACATDSPSGTAWTSTTDTLPNGIVLVTNSPPPSGIEPTWVIEPELVIGRVDGIGPDVFGQVRGIAPLKDGRIAVLEAQAREIRIFGSEGQHVRTLGGQGRGPGELSSPNGLVVGPDGRIRVNDPSNSRLSIFDADAGYIDSGRLEALGWGTSWDAVIDQTDGRIFELSMALIGGEPWHAIKVYNVDGVWADTIPVEPYQPPTPDKGPPGHYQFGSLFMAIPYWPTGARALDPRGFYWEKQANVNDYRLAQITFDGDTLLVIESRRRPAPVSAAERNAAIATLTGGSEDVRFDWSRIPSEQPIVRDLFLDDEGNIWVRVGVSDPGTTYDIFGRDGRYRGTAVTMLAVPTGWRPTVAGNTFYTLHTDEQGVPYVVRATIRGRDSLAEQ